MDVVELFYSLQGEGLCVGTPSVFVRLAGCPLRCRWCDTKYAWAFSGGTDCKTAELVEQIQRWSCRSVVITGGEPLVGPDRSARAGLVDLTGQLRALGKHITIETSGVAFVPELACDLMSISPKLGNAVPCEPALAAAHGQTRLDPEVLAALIEAYPCQLKFVIDSEADIGEVRRLLGQLPSVANENILLMPQAASRDELLVKAPLVARLCRDTGYRFGSRLHVLLWGNQRGT